MLCDKFQLTSQQVKELNKYRRKAKKELKEYYIIASPQACFSSDEEDLFFIAVNVKIGEKIKRLLNK